MLTESVTQTIPAMLRRNAEVHGSRPALTSGISASDRTITWSELRDEVGVLAEGLAELGLTRGERMLIMMSRRPEHWVVDLAAAHLGAISFTAYDTLSTTDIAYAASHSAAPVVILEGAEQLDRWLPLLHDLPSVRTIVVLDASVIPADDPRFISYAEVQALGRRPHPATFEGLVDQASPDDPLVMIYTSGTTGTPKGVVLSHRSVLFQAAAMAELVPVGENPRSVSYLPLAHIAERLLGIYMPLYTAGHVTIVADPANLVATLQVVHPDAFAAVPRIWEKLAIALEGSVRRLDPMARAAVEDARQVALQVYRLRADRVAIPADLERRAADLDAAVLCPIRAEVGLDVARRLSSGAAPIAVGVLESLASFGLDMLEVWGLSEAVGGATMGTREHFAIGGVGRPIPGVELRLAEDGEIMLRGPIVFLGYLQADGSIQPDVDEDGWLATGDLGRLDAAGILFIIGRKKEILINAAGKNIAPAKIESLLVEHPMVGHAIAIGDARRYITALVALDELGAPGWAKEHGIDTVDIGELATHPAVLQELGRLVEEANTHLARVEQIKKFRVLPGALSVETGELTPTLKVRRHVVQGNNAAAVEAMYA